ncbi:MAG: hypothetical protein KDI04_07595 [Halieaceae bacterium]|nr:hypothetical protein [Halieaceae bacterium]
MAITVSAMAAPRLVGLFNSSPKAIALVGFDWTPPRNYRDLSSCLPIMTIARAGIDIDVLTEFLE